MMVVRLRKEQLLTDDQLAEIGVLRIFATNHDLNPRTCGVEGYDGSEANRPTHNYKDDFAKLGMERWVWGGFP